MQDVIYEDEFVCDVKEWDLLPDGIYEAVCVDYEISHGYGRMKLYLHFEIISPEDHADKRVYMPMNLPKGNRITGINTKYYKLWSMFNGKRPSRNARMSPRVFKNKICRIRTKTRLPNDRDPKPWEYQYSIVDEVLEVLDNRGADDDSDQVPF